MDKICQEVKATCPRIIIFIVIDKTKVSHSELKEPKRKKVLN
jgi:hypothetical protein